jgi:hypothetical protein
MTATPQVPPEAASWPSSAGVSVAPPKIPTFSREKAAKLVEWPVKNPDSKLCFFLIFNMDKNELQILWTLKLYLKCNELSKLD